MSIDQVESAILELPLDERRRLLVWLDEHRQELFGVGDEIPPAIQNELLQRRQEYFQHPDRFIHLNNEEELSRFFEGIRREVQTRVSSLSQG